MCVCSPEELARNHASAVGRGLPWLTASADRSRPLAIVGGGPSARDSVGAILSWPGDVLTVNGAYDWLVGLGRTPEWCVLLDPQEAAADFATRPQDATTWLVATMCHPAVFDALRASPVALWLAPQGDDDISPGSVPGGPTAMTRAPVLALILGYREMTLFGADSCYRGEASHAYGGGTVPKDAFWVESNGRRWLTALPMLAQAEYLAELLPSLPGVRLDGDHLASALLASQSWVLAT